MRGKLVDMSKEFKKKIKERAINIKKLEESRVFMKLGAKLRAYFFTGILVTAPVSLTLYMAYRVIMWIDAGANELLPPQVKNYLSSLPVTLPGLGVVILIVSMILIGMFAAGFLGKFFLRLGEWVLHKLPFISSVYSLFKQIFETFLSSRGQAFSKVVLFEYPRKGIWILGLMSGETTGEVKSATGEDMYNIFVPTTPNPTSGFLLFVPKKDVKILNMSVEDGLKFVISGGIVSPDNRHLK